VTVSGFDTEPSRFSEPRPFRHPRISHGGEARASSLRYRRLHSRKRSGRERPTSDAAGNQTSDLGEADVAEVGKHDLPRLDDRAEDRAVFAVFAACGGIPKLPGGGQAQGPL
jgi:hypothetical protein